MIYRHRDFAIDADMRQAMRDVVEKAGHRVEAFATADDFLSDGRCERCSGDPCCDRLLVDVLMPGTSGVDLVRRLKSRHCPVRRVALVSGMYDEKMQEAADGLHVEMIDKVGGFGGFMDWLKSE